MNGERFEQFGIHRRPRDPAWPIRQRQIHLAERECADDGEGLIELGELPVLRRRQVALPALSAVEARGHELELACVRIAERLQDDGVDEGEDGGVRADAQGECQDRDEREPGILTERAQRVANILDDFVEPCRDPDAPRILPGQRDVAELQQARRRASSGGIPRSTLSCVSRSMWSRMSSSSPSSARLPPFIGSLLCGGTENPRDGVGQRVPLVGFDIQLPAAFGRQSVELGAAVVLRGSALERDPATLDQAVQRRIQRALLDEQHIVRSLLNRLRDGVSVRRAQAQGAKNQEIERALEERDRLSIFLVDILGEATTSHLECQGGRHE